MGELTPTLESEIQVLRDLYAALNRGDIPAMVEALDPEIAWIEPSDYPGGGIHRGHAAVIANVSKGRGNWAEGTCEPDQFYAAADKIVAYLHIHVRVNGMDDWIDAHHAAVYTFRNGKAIEMRIIDDLDEALAFAGLKASDAVAT